MSRLVKIDFVAALVGRGLEHVAEEILLMIDHPPDLSSSQLVSKLVALLLFTCNRDQGTRSMLLSESM